MYASLKHLLKNRCPFKVTDNPVENSWTASIIHAESRLQSARLQQPCRSNAYAMARALPLPAKARWG